MKQLERQIDAVNVDANQDVDLYLRASASRESLLLRVRSHPRFETQAQLDEFIRTARQLATTELDTLNELGSAGAELTLTTTPKGFRSLGVAGSGPSLSALRGRFGRS